MPINDIHHLDIIESLMQENGGVEEVFSTKNSETQ
jgi:hypothetical protein